MELFKVRVCIIVVIDINLEIVCDILWCNDGKLLSCPPVADGKDLVMDELDQTAKGITVFVNLHLLSCHSVDHCQLGWQTQTGSMLHMH